jgi:GT2 family glycosyltransferase
VHVAQLALRRRSAILIRLGTSVTAKPFSVTVVIVCFNSADYLTRCLQALEAQKFREFDVILVDNASTDGSTDGVEGKHPSLHLRVERLQNNTGFAAANNLAARKAGGEWLALLNPDAFAEPDWLEQLLQAASQYPGAFFASRQIQANHPQLLDGDGDVYFTSGLAQRRSYNVPHYAPGPAREVFSACAAAALYPLRQFLEAGGFDEDYFAYQEDVDLGFRLRLRGLRCYLVPTAIVYHLGAGSSGGRSSFATYHGHRNLVWTYFKNMPVPWFWYYLPLHLVWSLISIIYLALRGQGLVVLHAKLDAVRGLPSALGKRASVQAGRRIEFREVLRTMNTNPLGPLEGIIDRTWPDKH